MNIIYIANARLPTEKAHGYQIMKMCEAFSEAGAAVELIVPRRFNPIKDDLFNYYGVKKNFLVRKIKCPDTTDAKFLMGWGSRIQSLFFLFGLLFYKIPSDAVVYTRMREAAWLFSFLAKKTFFEAHSFSFKFIFLQKILFRKTAGVICLTQPLKENFIKIGIAADKIIISPDAVDLKVFDLEMTVAEARRQLGLKADGIIVGYFGRFRTMEMEKGLSDVLSALKMLPAEITFLAVGGSPADLDFYGKIASKIGLSERVIFQEAVPRKSLTIYQKTCDILLMPFPDLSHYRYFMSPLKMFEYMASKRPIIASDLPSVREVLNENNALLVSPDKPEVLAEAIKKLAEDVALRGKLAVQAFKDVQQYTWDKRAEKILDFINNPNEDLPESPE